MSDLEGWTTMNEINFLKRLSKFDYKRRLCKYIEASKRRSDWGQIDRDVITAYVTTEIRRTNATP